MKALRSFNPRKPKRLPEICFACLGIGAPLRHADDCDAPRTGPTDERKGQA